MFISSNSPSCWVNEVTLTCDKTIEANYVENKMGHDMITPGWILDYELLEKQF